MVYDYVELGAFLFGAYAFGLASGFLIAFARRFLEQI